MEEAIKMLNQKIIDISQQVETLTSSAQESNDYIKNLRKHLIATQLINQAMFDVVIGNNPDNKEKALQLLQLILDSIESPKNNNEYLEKYLHSTIKHLLLKKPLTPEERRDQLYIVK